MGGWMLASLYETNMEYLETLLQEIYDDPDDLPKVMDAFKRYKRFKKLSSVANVQYPRHMNDGEPREDYVDAQQYLDLPDDKFEDIVQFYTDKKRIEDSEANQRWAESILKGKQNG